MKRTLILVLLLVGLFIAGFALMHSLQSVLPFSLGIDLVPRWVGTEAMLEGISPYSMEARQRTWRVVYGTEEPQGNVFGFYYPPAITTILMPFVLAGFPIDVATVSFSALIWSLWVMALFLASHEKKRLSLAVFLFSGILFRPAFSNYILGQNALLGVLTFSAAYALTQKQKWIAAGVLLALSLLKPSFMILPVGLLLFLYRQRMFWFSFLLMTIILNLPSFFFIGWWIPDFLKEISAYARENYVAWSTADIFTLAGILWLGLSLVLTLYGFRQKDNVLLLAAALALNSAFTPHTADYDLVVFLGLLFWLETRIPVWMFLSLLWIPWISLFMISGIEMWYRFIWLVYPSTVLLVVVGTAYQTHKQAKVSV